MSWNIFEGEHVRLRSVEPDDWRFHYEWDHDSESMRNSHKITVPNSKASALAWAEEQAKALPENGNYRFQIESLDGHLVGTINTHDCDMVNGTFSYGIAIHPSHRQRGYATEAIRLLLRYYFMEKRFQKVTVEIYAFNKGSIILHERFGFHHEGRLRRMVYTNGEYHDALIYGMTREEFLELHG